MTHLVRGRLAVVLAIALLCPEARGEDLNDAWSQAIGLNAGLEARELDSFAAVMNPGGAIRALAVGESDVVQRVLESVAPDSSSRITRRWVLGLGV